MCYVYILKSKKDNQHYIGSTKSLRSRIKEHVNGRVDSTKNRRPLILLGWRKFVNIKDAAKWEKKYKRSHGQIERDFKNRKIKIYKNI